MQHLDKNDIILLARILKAFEDMGASPEELVKEAASLADKPNLIYDWGITLGLWWEAI